MKKIIVAAPFGNYLRFEQATSTIGTYTFHHRAGFWKRLWRVMSTVRYDPKTGSWINKLGLPNPGADALTYPLHGKILSVHGFNDEEWAYLIQKALALEADAVELNLSCPNVGAAAIDLNVVENACRHQRVIAKLPPVRWMEWGRPLFQAGVRTFHLCNTIPTRSGGLSGKVLQQYSLWAVDEFRQTFGDSVTLIGGGGITELEDVKRYINAGADHVSLASMLFNPFNWKKVKEFHEALVP